MVLSLYSRNARPQKEAEGAAWLVPCAHGTPTMKLWSFDVRSWEPNQAAPLKEKRASLEGSFRKMRVARCAQ